MNCRFARPVEGKQTAIYFLCERSRTDRTFLKYPRLPVLRCSGYVSSGKPEAKVPELCSRWR
ncbi:MAG: hypothetical protein DMG30_17280 [Acidobacteria bacterium]|nr:MAG: hypothetical protein DMG30_17280 [Acidobacteriota bacterium]